MQHEQKVIYFLTILSSVFDKVEIFNELCIWSLTNNLLWIFRNLSSSYFSPHDQRESFLKYVKMHIQTKRPHCWRASFSKNIWNSFPIIINISRLNICSRSKWSHSNILIWKYFNYNLLNINVIRKRSWERYQPNDIH